MASLFLLRGIIGCSLVANELKDIFQVEVVQHQPCVRDRGGETASEVQAWGTVRGTSNFATLCQPRSMGGGTFVANECHHILQVAVLQNQVVLWNQLFAGHFAQLVCSCRWPSLARPHLIKLSHTQLSLFLITDKTSFLETENSWPLVCPMGNECSCFIGNWAMPLHLKQQMRASGTSDSGVVSPLQAASHEGSNLNTTCETIHQTESRVAVQAQHKPSTLCAMRSVWQDCSTRVTTWTECVKPSTPVKGQLYKKLVGQGCIQCCRREDQTQHRLSRFQNRHSQIAAPEQDV